MKVFLAVLLCCATLVRCDDEWVPKTPSELKAIHEECQKERPLSEEQIAKMKNFEFPDEESVRQHLLCRGEKIGLFCPHEGYHADRIVKQAILDMDESEALTIIQGCIDKNEQGSPTDVWAFRGHKCLMASKIGDKLRAYLKKRQEEELKAQKE